MIIAAAVPVIFTELRIYYRNYVRRKFIISFVFPLSPLFVGILEIMSFPCKIYLVLKLMRVYKACLIYTSEFTTRTQRCNILTPA